MICSEVLVYKSIIREIVTEDIHIELVLPSMFAAKLQSGTRMRLTIENYLRNQLSFILSLYIQRCTIVTYEKT